MLTLRELPDLTDTQFWEHGNGNFVKWPADEGSTLVIVKISTEALSRLEGEQFAINIDKTAVALTRHRDLIEVVAREKHRKGATVVQLDDGDFPRTG